MNVAMVGAWHVHAKGYAEDLQKIPDVNMLAVWDADAAVGQDWAAELGCRYEPDYAALLADPNIDGIVMTAPTSAHGEMLVQAAQAGKHIFTEKVLAIHNEDAAAIADAVHKAGVVFTISFPHACRPALQFAKQLLDSGELGEITYARVRNAHNGASARWLPETFYDKAQCGGGAMMDLGAHPMYLLHWLLGEAQSIQSCFTQVTGKAVEDNAVSVLAYKNGAIALAETAFVAQNNPFQLELCGTAGTLLLCGDDIRYASTKTGDAWVRPQTLPQAWPSPLEQWVAAVVHGGENHMAIDEAVALTKLMVGAYSAWESGQRYSF